MLPIITLCVYCTLIVAASLVGGMLPAVMRLTHTRLQLMMSAVAGLMLGVAVLHLFPHSVEFLAADLPFAGVADADGDNQRETFAAAVTWSAVWLLTGVLLMFFLIRAFDFHQHGEVEAPHDHDHHHDHDHAPKAHGMSWVGLALGLSLHTAIDGVALAASVFADSRAGLPLPVFGLGVFLAIVLHKPLDALSITAVMSAADWSRSTQMLVNGAFALMCPLGAAVFALSMIGDSAVSSAALGCALAFSGGVFLCIALGDLLPELHFHRHDRIKLSIALLFGVAVAVAIEFLPGHSS